MPGKRRDTKTLVDTILSVLPVNSRALVSKVAFDANIDIDTANKWLDLIYHIQQEAPVLQREKMKGKNDSEKFVYYRETKAGRPKKEKEE